MVMYNKYSKQLIAIVRKTKLNTLDPPGYLNVVLQYVIKM